MKNQIEQRREFIINVLYFALVALIIFVSVRYALKWIMPFIIGFFIAFLTRPAASALRKVTKMHQKLAGFLALVLGYAAIVFALWLLGSKIFISLRDLFVKLPEYYDSTILPFLSSAMSSLENLAKQISPETLDQLYSMAENTLDSLRSYILRISSGALSAIAGTTARIPFYFISFAFTILASVFISMDYDKIIHFIKNQLPPRGRQFMSDAKSHIGKTVLGYLRAYTIILLITFTELCIGFWILKIENAVGLAAIIALADILPVVGTGGILIPWAIVMLFTQNYILALGLIIIYIVILVVRNFTEPKIIGDQLGLNPLVTLIAIYLGYRFMGVLGMIALPLVTNILVGLHRAGKIKLWRE